MPKAFKILQYVFICFLITMVTSCAPAKKNTYYAKRKKTSHVSTSQLGRNKYFFSSGYQKKLNKNYKK